jgi:hypothetical protein
MHANHLRPLDCNVAPLDCSPSRSSMSKLATFDHCLGDRPKSCTKRDSSFPSSVLVDDLLYLLPEK